MTSAKTKLVLVSLVLCCCSNRAISGEIGRRFAGLGKEVGACIDQQAQLVAPKAVDLETASVAVIGRCKAPIAAFRQFVYTSFPNFHPDQEWWSKELEPEFLKACARGGRFGADEARSSDRRYEKSGWI